MSGASPQHAAHATCTAAATPAAASTVPLHTDRLVLVVGIALVDTAPCAQGGRPRVLLAQRPPGKANAGLWEYPGGKVDPGETPEGACVRELREELGVELDASALQPLSFVSWPYPTFHLLMPLYVCTRWSGQPVGAEGQAVVWVTEQEMATYPLTPADVPLAKDVARALRELAAAHGGAGGRS
eukprot:CAMPEP_0202877786 /NCGR_PEP_ID=MMETSP1391-20130828/31158_1 /ASSEMBLY_ACC=CAM_ASM_000867 /TAXON_ID=1034604 /ORGANISM="Chlamydomonas leiostraca, Strain SAG 11-49" /LENGTH=183 /DNA_ID=CAMNT_0049559879 /DNA_START=82 /DNA_END=633 /DNA_ORIENTATION=+